MNRRTVLTVGAGIATVAGMANVSSSLAAITEAQANAVDEDLRLAMLSGRRSKLERVLSPALTWGHSNGLIQTRDEFVGALESRTEVFHTLEFRDRHVMVLDQCVVTRQTFVSDLTAGGQDFSVTLGEMLVWRREHGSLRCIARQAYKV